MQTVNFEEVLEKIIAADSRYDREAYFFLREALDHTQRRVYKPSKSSPKPGEDRHVTGQQLLDGIRDYALLRFGPMTLQVLDEWGIRKCEDFGEMVFNLVEHRMLGKTDKDSREDFKGGYDFNDAFRAPFIPKNRQAVPLVDESKPAES